MAGNVRRKAKGGRFLWQYGEKWMTEQRQEKLSWLRGQMKMTSQGWTLKELAKDIWSRLYNEQSRHGWLQVGGSGQ
ncbi:hypothetical protein AV903_24445 [Erwinia tracheiphila]|uniref:Transposase n=1 Tax=Erwinia tracheiphila TaxID=65700 RepID=A0A345CYB7_9GAMM|nr:hypothetical protein AV903_24445 [Erwinia tracheiphila]